MKNNIYLLFVLCFLPSYVLSQDTVYVEGIVIQRALSNELKSIYDNKILHDQGKSYRVVAGFTRTDEYFFSIKIGNSQLIEEGTIEPLVCSLEDYKNLEVFKDFRVIEDSTINWAFRYRFDRFFQSPRNSAYVYRVMKIKGPAVRTKIDNDYLNRNRNLDLEAQGISSWHINRSIPAFYLYTFLNIDEIDFHYHLPGFVKWKGGAGLPF